MSRLLGNRIKSGKAAIVVSITIILVVVGLTVRISNAPEKKHAITNEKGAYKVDYVYDGDSLKLIGGIEVRLVGIDSPDRDYDPVNADDARKFLQKLLNGKEVVMAPAREPRDNYGRTLAYLYLETSKGKKMVNAMVVRNGFAYAWRYEPNSAHTEEILDAQKKAQNELLGIWKRPPKQSSRYIVRKGRDFSLTHRPGCKHLKTRSSSEKTFEKRNDALNSFGGSPPCRLCKP